MTGREARLEYTGIHILRNMYTKPSKMDHVLSFSLRKKKVKETRRLTFVYLDQKSIIPSNVVLS
jgi:hypothetical protein